MAFFVYMRNLTAKFLTYMIDVKLTNFDCKRMQEEEEEENR
jgi:hypothetical protein